MKEISNYFYDHYTSGFLEGLNNKIKAVKRRCYEVVLKGGYLFQRIYLGLEGMGNMGLIYRHYWRYHTVHSH